MHYYCGLQFLDIDNSNYLDDFKTVSYVFLFFYSKKVEFSEEEFKKMGSNSAANALA